MDGEALFPHLFQPLKIGAIEVRNRILSSAHQTGLAEDGVPGERYVAYQRERARGGVALIITGATPVHESSLVHSRDFLRNVDDRIIPGYRRFADAVHAEGARAFAQLAHFGALADPQLNERAAWAPSPVAAELYRQIPHQMTEGEIAEVIEAFARAATRAREGGLDGVELLFAFGLLVAAFMSPYANHRTDRWGGSLENRLRFPLAVIDAVRARAGRDFVVGLRIPGDELVPGGLDRAHMLEIAQRFDATGQIDYLNVIAGNNLERFARIRHWPPTPAPHGLFVELAAGIKRVVTVPVFCVGRVTDPAMAEEIVARGDADMVGMTRAQIADPHLVRKAREGRLDEIRPCVGANVCVNRNLQGLSIRCIHNPDIGHEAEWAAIAPAAMAKHVVVIGGGPAGLEAARVAAARGHRVTLLEQAGELGGQVRLWTRAPAMGEIVKVVDYLAREAARLGVDVKLGTVADAAAVVALEPDAVVVATGSRPYVPDVPGAADGHVAILSAWDVLSWNDRQGRRAVVVDEVGRQDAPHVALHLAQRFPQVDLITTCFHAAEDEGLTVRIPLFEQLHRCGVRLTPHTRLQRIDGGAVVVSNVYSQQELRLEGVDVLALVLGAEAVDGLMATLRGRVATLVAVGDCVAPRRVEIAVKEASRVAREL